ncbi:MAG: PIG-L family deacetylase [Lyngbya sp.]|nr:PIG-L family deacetylase [Lyngbya sp.]
MNPIRQFYRQLAINNRKDYSPENLGKSAIIFSPHQDDETLGCGGTIIRKKQAGADIKLVFMTDGSGSHAHLMNPQNLKILRMNEALEAAEILGIDRGDVFFLNFKDGSLKFNQPKAIPKVLEILCNTCPEEVFIPYSKEEPPDHWATYQIVQSALQQSAFNLTVYEYPIWFWRQWPWTSLVGRPREVLSCLKNTWMSGFGYKFFTDLNCSVYIADVLEQKRTALEQHRSQIQRLVDDSSWMTLGDLSKGEFLDCFFQEYEFFYPSKITSQ